MIYGCPRTASVVAAHYSTYALLTQENYKLLLTELPEIEEEMRKFTYTYYDRHKRWLLKNL